MSLTSGIEGYEPPITRGRGEATSDQLILPHVCFSADSSPEVGDSRGVLEGGRERGRGMELRRTGLVVVGQYGLSASFT